MLKSFLSGKDHVVPSSFFGLLSLFRGLGQTNGMKAMLAFRAGCRRFLQTFPAEIIRAAAVQYAGETVSNAAARIGDESPARRPRST
jgi:hypothetical protein